MDWNINQLIQERLSQNEPYEGTYVGEDGLLYCEKCKEPVQKIFEKDALGKFIYPRPCSCRMAEMEQINREQEERRHYAVVSSNASVCFRNGQMRFWTFEADDGTVPAMSIAKEYVERWEEFRRENIGLLLWGGVGTGKTFMACCIANALLDKEVSVYMTDFAQISNKSVFDLEEYIDSLCKVGLLIIDDLGAERKSEFATQNVFDVINRRMLSGRPLIVTTNLSIREMKQKRDGDLTTQRIYDRLLEMCTPVQVDGKSKRVENAEQKQDCARRILGR